MCNDKGFIDVRRFPQSTFVLYLNSVPVTCNVVHADYSALNYRNGSSKVEVRFVVERIPIPHDRLLPVSNVHSSELVDKHSPSYQGRASIGEHRPKT